MREYIFCPSRAYERDICVVKKYGIGDNKKLKIILMKNCRVKGVETGSLSARNENVNESKLENNISRAKRKIFELAECNPWTFFFTGTLDKSKYNRQDLAKYHHDLSQFFRDQGKKWDCKIDWLVIPELHADGESWHVHGLIQGLPEQALRQFKIGDKMGKALAEKVQNGDKVYEWQDYSKKFGFCDLEYIKSDNAISKYITKYVTEELGRCVTDLGAHLYYHSRGLKFAELVCKGFADLVYSLLPFGQGDFNNEYVSIYWYESSIDVMEEELKLALKWKDSLFCDVKDPPPGAPVV